MTKDVRFFPSTKAPIIEQRSSCWLARGGPRGKWTSKAAKWIYKKEARRASEIPSSRDRGASKKGVPLVKRTFKSRSCRAPSLTHSQPVGRLAADTADYLAWIPNYLPWWGAAQGRSDIDSLIIKRLLAGLVVRSQGLSLFEPSLPWKQGETR